MLLGGEDGVEEVVGVLVVVFLVIRLALERAVARFNIIIQRLLFFEEEEVGRYIIYLRGGNTNTLCRLQVLLSGCNNNAYVQSKCSMPEKYYMFIV